MNSKKATLQKLFPCGRRSTTQVFSVLKPLGVVFGDWQNCYRNEVWLLATQKPVIEGQVLVERTDALFRKASNLGRRWTLVQRPTGKVLLSHDIFKGKKGETIWIIKVGGQILHYISIVWRPTDFSLSSFGCYLAYVVCLQIC